MKLRILAIILISLSMSGCYSIQSRYSYDDSVDFAVFKSYAWDPTKRETFVDPEVSVVFRDVMNEKLAEKGYLLDQENPDFTIITARVDHYKETYHSLYGPVQYSRAMLRITFKATGDVGVFYEAAADAFIDPDASLETKYDMVPEVVDLLLERFPPD